MNFGSKKITTHLFVILATIVTIVYFLPREKDKTLTFEENRPWDHSKLIAPFEIYIYPDTVAVVDSLDNSFIPIAERNDKIFDSISAIITNKNAYLAHAIIPTLQSQYELGIIDANSYNMIENGKLPSLRMLDNIYLNKVPTDNFSSPRKTYLMVDSLVHDSTLRTALKELNLQNLIIPNIVINETKSKTAYEEDLARATAPIGVIMQGELIIDRGQKVTSNLYRVLNTYIEMLQKQAPDSHGTKWMKILGQFLFVLIIVIVLYFYMVIFRPDIPRANKKLIFVMILLCAFSVLASIASTIFTNGIYIVPFVIIPIVILVFFDARTAIFCHIIEILICSSFAPFPQEFIVVEFCAGAAAVYSLKELSKRSQLIRTAVITFITYAISFVAIEILLNGTIADSAQRIIGFIAINAVLTSFAYILMFLIEKAFGLISVVTLVELSDINSPLLRQLSEQCPGTFQHSMAVSNLAADAAGRINANVQLVRAGALYHDIGKIKNPAFFTENQRGVNPHDSLDPISSAEIVVSHVSDGIKLASKAKLPSIIIDFIKQHHGCGKAKYFYITHCQKHPNEVVDETPFTYPGPNPNTKETSILMMADAVEAASRSLKDHSLLSITTLVNRIIDSQIDDGLHNNSPIAFRDIKVVKESFINSISTMYHSRIIYPETGSANAKNNNNNPQPSIPNI